MEGKDCQRLATRLWKRRSTEFSDLALKHWVAFMKVVHEFSPSQIQQGWTRSRVRERLCRGLVEGGVMGCESTMNDVPGSLERGNLK